MTGPKGEKLPAKPIGVDSRHDYPDYWMYSTSTTLSEEMLQRFSRSCCVLIGGPWSYWLRFGLQIANELIKKRFVAKLPDGATEPLTLPLKNGMMRDVEYHRKPTKLDDDR